LLKIEKLGIIIIRLEKPKRLKRPERLNNSQPFRPLKPIRPFKPLNHMPLILFNNLTEGEKSDAIKKLISDSSPRQDFFLMVVLAILMATFGLLLDSVAIIIGSMLIAPILWPILSLSLGIVIADRKVIGRSAYTLLKSILFGVAASALVSVFFVHRGYGVTMEIMNRTQPSLMYAAVAIVAGLAVSFAVIKPHLNETFPGIAISVALIPPIAVMGIGLAKLNWAIISQSFMLFAMNTAGIIFSSMIVFSLMNLYIKRKDVIKAVKKDEKEIRKEVKKAEKN